MVRHFDGNSSRQYNTNDAMDRNRCLASNLFLRSDRTVPVDPRIYLYLLCPTSGSSLRLSRVAGNSLREQ